MRGLGRAVRLVSTLRKLNSAELDVNLRRRIARTYLRTFFLKRYDARNKVADVAGYRVRFLTYDSLAYLFHEIFVSQEYSFRCARPDPVILDCGSNIGMSILYFKTIYPESSITAFEPDEETFACLETNVRANGLKGVTLHRKAVADEDGAIAFYFDQESPGSLTMSTVWERQPKQKQMVEAARLSRHIDGDVDFLKMDVEGAELRVFEELHREGKLARVKQIAVEYHHHIVKDEDRLSRLLAILEESGFGYQIEAAAGRPLQGGVFQDILVYAYRRPPPG